MSKVLRFPIKNLDNITKYVVVNYFDVWGNEEEGYEVNDSCVEKEPLFIPDRMEEIDILDMMVDKGFLTSTAVSITNMGDGWEIESHQGLPLYGIRLPYENEKYKDE